MSWNHPSYMVLLEGANSLWCKRNTFKTFTPVLIARFSQSVTHPPECHSSKRRLVRDHNLIPPAPPPLLCVGEKSNKLVKGCRKLTLNLVAKMAVTNCGPNLSDYL